MAGDEPKAAAAQAVGAGQAAAAAGAASRLPRRHFGRKPRRRAPGRQGLPHPGAALAQPGRRDRHRGAAQAVADLRRGEGARRFRRGGGIDQPASAAAHRRRGGSLAGGIRPTAACATSASTSFWSCPARCRGTFRRRSECESLSLPPPERGGINLSVRRSAARRTRRPGRGCGRRRRRDRRPRSSRYRRCRGCRRWRCPPD